MKTNAESSVYEFDGFRLDAGKRLLWNRDQPVALTPKVFDTLLYLVRYAGQTVHKDDLMVAIWPDTVVEENNLNKNISVLRQLLCEKRGEHRFVVTVPGKGYRFVACVVETSGNEVPDFEMVPFDNKSQRLTLPPLAERYRRLPASSSSYRIWLVAALTVTFFVTGSYLSRGRGHLHSRQSGENAHKRFLHAYDPEPGDIEGELFLAHLYSNNGKHDKALALRDQTKQLDLLTINRNALAGQFLYYAGRYDESIDSLEQASKIHPHHWLPRVLLARSYTEKEMFREAIASCEEAKQLGSSSLELIALQGWSYAKLRNTEKAYSALQELEQISKQRPVPSYFPALIHNALGEKEIALSLLEKGLAARDVRMAFLHFDPKWNNLREEPRFIAIMQTMRFE